MAIEKIDPNKCIGCGTCKLVCSSDVIALREEDGKAYVKYPEDCIVCAYSANRSVLLRQFMSHLPMTPSNSKLGDD